MVTEEWMESSAPVLRVPSRPLVTIEYPGIVGETAESLNRALATLSPHNGPNSGLQSALSALKHITRVIGNGGKLLECRLEPLPGESSEFQMYRHPLLGDIVPGRELVIRVSRCCWQRRGDNGVLESRKQYRIELVGAVHSTIRFLRMADFAFKPEKPIGSPFHPTEALHRALVTMDVNTLQGYRFAPENEEYQSLDTFSNMQSNLAMIPPPFFSRMELPFNYGYRQNPASSLQTVPYASVAKRSRRTARKGQIDPDQGEADHRLVTRYLNRSRWRNFAPIAINFNDPDPVPSEPAGPLMRLALPDRQKQLLERIQSHFNDKPIWSRLSLLNQFSRNDARTLMQAKELFALTAYTFSDGPWRDTLIRFDYDPRTAAKSRFFQRIHLRGKPPRTPLSRGLFKTEANDVSPIVREPDNSAEPSTAHGTHVFDGKTPVFASSTFQLCDVTDPNILPLIHTNRPNDLRDSPDIASGWYSSSAWEAIRTAISGRFHALLEMASHDQEALTTEENRNDDSTDESSEVSEGT